MKKNRILVRCPYCGSLAQRRPASVVYGADALDPSAYLYVCAKWPTCDAYVGEHKRTHQPLGTLANGELRHKRILAHHALEKLCARRSMDKRDAYVWLQLQLGIPAQQAHIGMFSDYRCDELIRLCEEQCQPARRENCAA